MWWTLHAPAELMRVFELLEELQRVIDAVHTEIERIDIRRAERHQRLAARPERMGLLRSEKYGSSSD